MPHDPLRNCGDCSNAALPGKDAAAATWLRERGLAHCKAYSARLGHRQLITIINAAGPLCSGRDYAAKQVDLF